MNSSKAILSANGGVHSKRAMKKVKDRLANHGMKRAILVHFVLTGSQSVQVYRDTYNDIADHIRDNGSRCEYFGCLEVAKDKGGLHAHAFFVIETSKKFPNETLDVRNGAWLHRLAERRGLVNMDGSTRIIHIAPPQNKMHNVNGKKQFFARLDDEAKLADCLERVEYLYKNRSKEDVPSREIYFNSNFEANKAKRVKKIKPVIDSPSAPKAEQVAIPVEAIRNDCKPLQSDSQPLQWVDTKTKPEPHQEAVIASQTHNDNKERNENSTTTQYQAINEGEACSRSSEARCNASMVGSRPNSQASTEARSGLRETSSPRYSDGSGASTPDREGQYEMKLTPAEAYVATQYETAVDQQLDVEALRLFLLERSIKRTPAQVVDELENVFGFLGYASRHPTPAKPDTRMLDALIDRTPLKSVRYSHGKYIANQKLG